MSSVRSEKWPTANNSKFRQFKFHWEISEETVEKILDDIEIAIIPIKNIVANLQPLLPNFDKSIVVATRPMCVPESDSGGIPSLDMVYTYVSPMSMEEIIFSTPETAYGRYLRKQIPMQDFCPGEVYRGMYISHRHVDCEPTRISRGLQIVHELPRSKARNDRNRHRLTHH